MTVFVMTDIKSGVILWSISDLVLFDVSTFLTIELLPNEKVDYLYNFSLYRLRLICTKLLNRKLLYLMALEKKCPKKSPCIL